MRSKGRHFHDVRDRLIDMNAGLRRCMYCEADRGAIHKKGRGPITAIIDHWKPIAHDPLSTFDWRNLFLTCGMCNSIVKGSAFPVGPNGDPQLLHPVDDDPIQEISFLPSSCSYVAPAGTKAHTTIGFFHLDDADLESSRRGVWRAYVAFLREYDQFHSKGDVQKADATRADLLVLPFRTLLVRMADYAQTAPGAGYVDPDVVAIILKHKVWLWL